MFLLLTSCICVANRQTGKQTENAQRKSCSHNCLPCSVQMGILHLTKLQYLYVGYFITSTSLLFFTRGLIFLLIVHSNAGHVYHLCCANAVQVTLAVFTQCKIIVSWIRLNVFAQRCPQSYCSYHLTSFKLAPGDSTFNQSGTVWKQVSLKWWLTCSDRTSQIENDNSWAQ